MKHATLALAAFTLRRLAAGKRFASAIVILSVAPLMALLIALLAEAPAIEVFHGLMIGLSTYIAPLLLALIYSIAFSSAEIEDGTASLVLLAALPKWLAALVQLAVMAAGLSALSLLSIGTAWALLRLGGSGEVPEAALALRYSMAAGVATLAYASAFTVFGYAFRRGVAASVAVAVVWEMMVVIMPVKFAAFTITNNVRALVISWGLEGERGEHFRYAIGYDFPTYGEAAMFLSIAVATLLSLGMVAVMNRNLTAKE